MEHVLPSLRLSSRPSWRAVLMPKEHGSWSLALEPVALGLLAAPSPAGAALGLVVVAAFLARRPLRIAATEPRAERRASAGLVFGGCTIVGAAAMALVVAIAGWQWIGWLLPATLAGLVFLSFDIRGAGRDEIAEVAGAAAFGLLPATFAILGGRSPGMALALAILMCGRAVPTVLCVRAALRTAKREGVNRMPALITAGLAVLAAIALARSALAPWFGVVATGALAVRAALWLVFPRPALRGRTLGLIEAALGVAFVVGVAASWPE